MSRGLTFVPLTSTGSGRVQPELVQRLQDVDELVAEPVLERHTPAVDPPRDQQDLVMLDVDAIDRTDPLREDERLGFTEWRQREPAALLLPHDRRIEALLDRRPDREAGRERVSLDHQVGAVTDVHLVDVPEQVILRVTREDVGETGLDAHPDQREQASFLPRARLGELRIAQLDARLPIRVFRVRL